MSDVIMEVNGNKADIKLFDNKIKISRRKRGGLLGGIPQERVIMLKDISNVNFTPVLRFRTVYGFIQFVIKGAQNREYSGNPREYSIVDSDENVVTFGYKEMPLFEELRDAVEEQLSSFKDTTSGNVIMTQTSNMDELEKLAGLLDKGIITKEEFEAKKKQLLGL